MYKFKYGDKVKVVSHSETVAYFGGDSVCLAEIGTESTVVNICDQLVGIKGEVHYLHVEDLILLENAEKEVLIGDGVEVEPVSKDNVNGIPSDGGSSDYYFTKLPQHLINRIVETGGIEIKDIIRYVFDNSADAFNIVKAQKRIVEASKGKGKLGITALYDANKIKFFANEQYEAIKQGEVE